MKAAFITDSGIKITDIPIPEPGYGEVVIKVEAALTDGTDLKALIRGHNIVKEGPFGHEYSGVVVNVGEGVENFKVGDRVFGVNTAPCYKCSMCLKNRYNLCENLRRNMVMGSYAEYLLIPEKVVSINLFHKPDNIPFKVAPMIEPLACVFQALDRLTGYYESVLILGSGSIGAMFSSVLSLQGKEVYVAGRKEWKLRKISEHTGAKPLMFKTLKGKYDVVIETTGSLNVWNVAMDYVDKGGTVLLFGGLKENQTFNINAHKFHYEDIRIITSFHHTPQSVRRSYKFLCKNWKTLEFLVSREYKLEDIEKAFEDMYKGKVFKCAIIP